MKKLTEFWKKETVLCVALILAVISSFAVLPDAQYFAYIDFRTLAILFCLMSVMAGLQNLGVFHWIAERLLKRVKNILQLVLILVMLCFFFSMFITNDVALITFVPFTFTVLRLLDREQKNKLILPVVVMQTIAANLGSMLTPIGNPQNLYLYGKAGLSVGEFILLMLPYTLLSLTLLLVWGAGFGILLTRTPGQEAQGGQAQKHCKQMQINLAEQTTLNGKKKELTVYLVLFTVCLLTVARAIPYGITLAVVFCIIFFMNKKVLLQVDYALLLTFVGFFVFIGNMGRIPAFHSMLQSVVEGNEVLTAVVTSQAISNVPAALLLSGFTTNYQGLIVGTNLGGLGTLIASMASLISYKFVAREEGSRKGEYLLYFTAANICFLAALVILYILM